MCRSLSKQLAYISFLSLLAQACTSALGHPENGPIDSHADAGADLERPGDVAKPGKPGATPVSGDPSGSQEPPPNASGGAPRPGDENPDTNPAPQDLGDESGPGAIAPGTNPGGVSVECSGNPGVSPLLKLSTVEYRKTVQDLLSALGLQNASEALATALSSVPDDSLGDGFRSLDARISSEHIKAYFDVGVAVGDPLLTDPDALEKLAGSCALEDSLSESCATSFLSNFLKLAYRRPVADEDYTEYLDLIANRSAAEAIRSMVIVALSSPRFVNHFEIDGTASETDPDTLQLTSYEIASKLSYTFWQSMPDAELFAAADDGSLATPEGFAEQLTRVFDDPRTKETLWQFWSEWLRFEKFTGFETSRPAFQALTHDTNVASSGHDYYADMVQEVRDLTELFTFTNKSTLADLASTDVSVTRSQDLAALYGVDPYDGGGNYPTLPTGTRAGLFQRAALLVSNLEQTNPFHRGATVRRALLCDALPQPDPNSLPPGSLDPPVFDQAQTTRERYAAKIAGNDLCSGCHDAFSNIGYVLESFDALGRYRTKETLYDEQTGDFVAELDLDTSADIVIGDAPASVTNALDLNQQLIASGKMEPCLAQHYFNYVARREVEAQSGDECVVADLAQVVADPEQGLKDAFRRIAQHPSFFVRKVGAR